MSVGDEGVGELLDWVAEGHARLGRGRFGSRRYVEKDVDAFIGDVTARLRRGEQPELSWVRSVRFHVTVDLIGDTRCCRWMICWLNWRGA